MVSKNVKNFTAQNAVRKMFFEEKFLKLIKKFFCTENANDAAVEAAERESLEGRLALINCIRPLVYVTAIFMQSKRFCSLKRQNEMDIVPRPNFI